MPNLKISDKKRDFVHQIDGDLVTIGRGPTNTIPIEDAKASKEHCRLERVGDRWKVVDLESKNGTRVNGEYCNKAWLDHGDTIRIGTAEIRFGVEGKQRAAVSGTRKVAAAAPVAGRGRTRTEAEYDDYDDERPPRRYQRDDASEKLIKWGAIVVGMAAIVLITSLWINRTTGDEHNMEVLSQAERLVQQNRWEEAISHLEKYGDTSGNSYHMVMQRINELRERLPAFQKDQREQGALPIVSKLGRKIKAYHVGKTKTTSPEEILQLVERLKTEFAGTERLEQARRQWPAWFKGRVPERASDYLASGGKLKKDWDEATRQAEEYRKAWQFREARETIAKFLTVREAVMDQNDRDYYRVEVDKRLNSIDRLADSVYRGRERLCRDLVKNRRYDEAIKRMQEVVEKFGLDVYVRKAQGQIERYKELKRTNKTG